MQAVCDELFGIELRLADHLTDRGVLLIVDGVITKDMFRVACVGHEMFGMSAVDYARRSVVSPRPDWEAESPEWCIRYVAALDSDFDAQTILEAAKDMREWQVQRAELERQVIQRVRAVRQQSRP